MAHSLRPVSCAPEASSQRMASVPEATPTIVRALALLDTMDRVARWLPAHEPKRPALIESVGHIRARVEASQPVTLAILLLQTEARSLTNGPLRTALGRQIAKLCRLYNIAGR